MSNVSRNGLPHSALLVSHHGYQFSLRNRNRIDPQTKNKRGSCSRCSYHFGVIFALDLNLLSQKDKDIFQFVVRNLGTLFDRTFPIRGEWFIFHLWVAQQIIMVCNVVCGFFLVSLAAQLVLKMMFYFRPFGGHLVLF